MIKKRKWLWLTPTLIYIVFTLWYTNLGGPLTSEEVDTVIQAMQANGESPEQIELLRNFMGEDTGKQFIMINNIDTVESPIELPATGPNASAGDLMNYYMEYMFPALFMRASHPIFMGYPIAPSMDIVGIDNAEVWTQGALMRYRSRRDLIEIATDPRFEERHEYKLAALDKTIAYPVEVSLYLSDPRFLLALILLCVTLILDLLVYRRP